MKKVFTAAIVLLLLLVVGCQQNTEQVAGKAFVGGTKGLEISFLPGMPPAEVYDVQSPFQIGIRLVNSGEYNIQIAGNIKAFITGILPSDFGVSNSQLTAASSVSLRGVSIDGSGNIIKGDTTEIDFPSNTQMQYKSTVSGVATFPLRANVCYEYGTNAQGLLCVRKDLRGVTGEAGVCNPNRQVPAENSGAPVQITNLKQNVAGSNKIDFFFTIKNVGAVGDSLHKKGSSCNPAIGEVDVVWVDVSPTGLGTISCSGLREGTATSGYTTLYNGEKEIRCSQMIDNLADVVTPVKISLTYGYKQFVETQLQVKHGSS